MLDVPEREEITTALARIPLFGRVDPTTISTTRLGGLTNANYLVEFGSERFVLRIPGRGTAAYIDRRNEEHAARATAAVGINAEVMFFDPEDGVQLCRFVEGGRTMSAESFRDAGAIRRAAASLRTVHRRAEPFRTDFDLFAMIDDYRRLLATRTCTLPEGYDEAVAAAEDVRAALATHPVQLVPCHCDPLAENFIDTGVQMTIVDWEYAGNNDPMWDLGDLAVEAELDADQEALLMSAYFDGTVPAAARGRMVVYKAMCDLLWTLWGVIQDSDGNPADDFAAYARRRLARCRELMARPEFAEHVQAVRRG